MFAFNAVKNRAVAARNRLTSLGRMPRNIRGVALATLGVAAVLLALWLGVFALQYRIDDNADLKPEARFVVAGGSEAIAMAETLMDQEIHKAVWAPNKPWFYPVAHSANMVNYQIGVQYAVARWATEMSDLIGRDRGSGQADNDLNTAAGFFKYEPTHLLFPSSVSQYDDGVKALGSYNRRLAKGQANYDKLSSNLSLFLDRIDKDLGSQSATIELTALAPKDLAPDEMAHLTDEQRRLLARNGGYFDGRATAIFFATKGRMYAYYVLLKAMGDDWHDVIAAKNAQQHWTNMLLSLRSGATFDKFFIANGKLGSYLTPNDVAAQGFFLLRADKQLRELTDILNK